MQRTRDAWRLGETLFGVLLAGSCMAPVWAYSETHDEYTLDLKGFSLGTVEAAQSQINRMEGRYPAPTPRKFQKLFLNFLNGDWVDASRPFAQDQVVPPTYR